MYVFHDEAFKCHFDIYNQRLSSVNCPKNEGKMSSIFKKMPSESDGVTEIR